MLLRVGVCLLDLSDRGVAVEFAEKICFPDVNPTRHVTSPVAGLRFLQVVNAILINLSNALTK